MTSAVAVLDGDAGSDGKGLPLLAFGAFVIDRNQRVLLRDGNIVRLTPKAFDLLELLISRAGEVVSKQELFDTLWPDTFVSEANLSKLVFVVRKEVGEPTIATIPKRGYRFVGEVRRVGPHVVAEPAPEPVIVPPPSRARISMRWIVASAVAVLILVTAIVTVRTMAARPQRTYVVVMPFTAVAGTDKSLAEGIGEFVGARLSTTRGISVLPPLMAAPSSASADPRRVARRLGANLLLAGTVQRIGDRIRVTYSITSVDDRVQIAAASLNATSTDIFELQERVAGDIASMLELRLSFDRYDDPLLVTPDQQQSYLRAIGLLAKVSERSKADEAIALLEPLHNGPKHSALVAAALGRAYLVRYRATREEKDLDLASRYATQAAQLDAGHARVRALLGSIAMTRGDFSSAVEHLKAALTLEPDANDVLLDLASVYKSLDRTADARSTFDYLLRIHPECAVCVNAYGLFHSRNGDLDRAVTMHRRAIALDPETARFHSDLGVIYMKLGQTREAIPWLEKAIAIRPTSAGMSNLGYCHYLLGDYEQAAKYFGEATQLRPADSLPWGNLGDALRRIPARGAEADAAFDRAIARSREAVRVNAKDAAVRAMLAEYLAKRGHLDEASREIATALKTDAEDSDVLLSAAVVNVLAGNETSAVDHLYAASAAGLSPSLFANDPQFDALRKQPRFVALIEGGRASSPAR